MIKNMIRYLQRKIKKLYELYIEKLQNTIYSKRVKFTSTKFSWMDRNSLEKLNIKRNKCVVLMKYSKQYLVV